MSRSWLRITAATYCELAALGVVVIGVAFVGVRYFAELPVPSASSAQDAPTLGFMPLASPRAIADIAFEDADGNKRTLAQFRGKSILLNVWATWCGPCRKEMPALDRLQAKLGSDDFQVVALSIDRGGVAAVKSFYDEIDVRSLGIYVDSHDGCSGQARRRRRPDNAARRPRGARSRSLHGPRRLGRSECRRNDPALSAAAQTALP